MHLEVLPESQAAVWQDLIAAAGRLDRWGFYVAGGTALALQLGHRRSVDFDLFSQQSDLGAPVAAWLQDDATWLIRDTDSRTVHAERHGVQVSFISTYQYPLVRPPVLIEGLRLASVTDIGLMKLLAITHRATVRDYLDLAAILRDHVALATLVDLSRQKYGLPFNPLIALKALVTYDDLDQETPVVLDPTLPRQWQTILRDAVKRAS